MRTQFFATGHTETMAMISKEDAFPRLVKVLLVSTLFFSAGFVSAQEEDDLLTDFSNSFDFQTLGGAVGRLEAHGNDLMGDMIDKNTGALTFSHTDVSIPGNSGLEVALRRKLTQGYKQESPYQQAFNDWALDIPIAYFSYGYDNSNDHPVFNDGCMTQEPSANDIFKSAASGASATFQAGTHESGFTLSIPGAGLSGFQSAWHSGLQDPDANWVSGGQGTDYNGNCAEIAIAPDGTQYKFGRHTFRMAEPQTVPAPFYPTPPSQANQNGIADVIGYSWLSVYKQYAVYLITEVVDVHGNYVRYEYNNDDDLARIYSNDNREITLEYNSTSTSVWGFELVSRVTANGRDWDYIYTDQSVVFGLRLDQVLLPDGRSWSFDTAVMSAEEHQHWNCVPSTIDPIEITHPDGAVGTFTISETRHIKNAESSYILGDGDTPPLFDPVSVGAPTETASGVCGPGHLIEHYAPPDGLPFYRVLSVVEKEISGPNIPTATWSFEYRGYDDGGTNDDWQDVSTTWTKITEPDGTARTYTYIANGRGMGLLESIDVLGYDGTSETITYDYDFADPSPPPFCAISFLSDDEMGMCHAYNKRPQTQMTRVRDGVTYTTISDYDKTGYDFDDYGYPNTVTRYSSQNASEQRITGIDYWHDFSANIIGLRERVIHNGKEFLEYDYETGTGLLEDVYTMGESSARESYTYHSDGTLHTITDALGHTATLTNYHRGLPEDITFRDNETFSRSVDNNGWVTSETNARGYTTYYDYTDMGWMTEIDRPSPWDDTDITYHNLGDSDFYRSITRGTRETVEWYDAMLRLTLIRQNPTSGLGVTSYVKTEYDALGRKIFTSLPSTSSNPGQGIDTDYDGLGRVEQMRENFGSFVTTTTEYLSGNKVRVTDPLNNQITTTFSGYGSPGDGNMTLIEQPEGIDTSMTYDIWGNMLSATQGDGIDSSTQIWTYNSKLQLCRHYTPETGSTLYDYDARYLVANYSQGNSGTTGCSSVPSSNRITHLYDERARLQNINYSDATPAVAITYDANGNVTSNVRGGTNWTYSYDSLDQLEDETLFVDGRTYSLGYEYDNMGNLIARTLPSGRTVDYIPNGLGQVNSVESDGFAYADAIDYHVNGLIDTLDYGNGQYFQQTINTRQLPERLTSSLGSTVALDLDYTYDKRSDVTDIIDWADRSRDRTMTYDDLGRLKTADGVWGTGDFDYDALGNLVQKQLGSRIVSVSYNSNNLANQSTDTAGGTRSIGYDGRGNVTTLGALNFVYDLSNQPTQLSGNSTGNYTYDGNFKRVKAVVDGETIYNVYDASGRLVHIDQVNGGGILNVCLTSCGTVDIPKSTDYLRASGMTIARLENGNPTYLHPDLLGSPVAATDTNGDILWEEHYTPFGEKWQEDAANDDQMGYTGHIADSATGLNYMQARYQDPVIGRFLSNDPVGFLGHLGGGQGPQGFNRYAYVNNNPMSYIDPTGKECVNNNDGTTNCVTEDYDVTFDTPENFPGTDAGADDYHYYTETANTSRSVGTTREWVKNNPTPGNPDPATPEGTHNDATPGLGSGGEGGISPVVSYVTENSVSGNEVVVNVTLPDHPLHPGIVVREVQPNGGGSTINNMGEGNGSLQKPGNLTAPVINGVWRSQRPHSPRRRQ